MFPTFFFWNKDKQQSDHKREYLGKYDGQIFTPNMNYRCLEAEYKQTHEDAKSGPVLAADCMRQFYGATYLLDQISEVIGITADLKRCFGGISKDFLSQTYFLILEEGMPFHRFHKWGATHRHPYGKDIPSQRSSELLSMIIEESKMDYFKFQARWYGLKEYLAFDATSIFSYSQLIKQAKYCKNKEGDVLTQINLALLYGEQSMLPVYYRKLPGNIADVRTIENLLKDIDFLELDKLKFVMDRGFYRERNINDMMKYHNKFIIGARTFLNIVSKSLGAIREDFVTRFNFNSEQKLYVRSFTEAREYI